MSTQREEALHILRRLYRDVVRLSSAVGPLDDPYALAHVDLCISMLTRLHEHLEAKAKGDEQRLDS